MKFNIWIVLSFLSTSVAFINTQFFCKTHCLVRGDLSKNVLFSQHNDKNENNRVERFTPFYISNADFSGEFLR